MGQGIKIAVLAEMYFNLFSDILHSPSKERAPGSQGSDLTFLLIQIVNGKFSSFTYAFGELYCKFITDYLGESASAGYSCYLQVVNPKKLGHTLKVKQRQKSWEATSEPKNTNKLKQKITFKRWIDP